MPFTPFHLGPGALCKAAGGDRFSFMVFGGAQVLMDLEPGLRMLAASPVLHGPSHTLAGAVAIGAVAAVIGKPVSEFVLRRSGLRHRPMRWSASVLGAAVGTLSHVLLDALVHADMTPGYPLGDGNPLLGLLSLPALQDLCIALGLLGGLGVAWRYRDRLPGTS